MSPLARAIFVAAIAALPLGGCVNFDPTEWLAGDLFSNKKPLPGERRPLFPEGVPGVARGVPPELVKGNQAAALQDQQAETSPIVVPDEPKPKPKARAKPKPRPKVVRQTDEPAREPTAVTVRPPAQSGQPQTQWPDPPARRPPPQQQQVQWPEPPGAKKKAPSQQVQWPDPPTPR
jgi:hypothetical protein